MSRLRNRPFALLGINSDKDRESLRRTIATEGITWRSWYDGSTDGPIATRWNLRETPTTYVLDHRGIIRFKNRRGKRLDDAVDILLSEMDAEGRRPR